MYASFSMDVKKARSIEPLRQCPRGQMKLALPGMCTRVPWFRHSDFSRVFAVFSSFFNLNNIQFIHGNPISLQERACKETTNPKSDKYVCRSYYTKLAIKSNSEERGGGGNKAMDCSRRRVLVCIAYASDRCNAIDTL